MHTGPSSAPAADQSLTLTYDDASNVHTITDGTNNEVATYGYDALNRLTSMALTLGGNAEPGASYVYDAANEMTSKTEGASTQSIYHGRTYGFGPAHAPWYLTSDGQDEVVAHDADGNLCSTWVGGTIFPYGFYPTFLCSPPPPGVSTYRYDAENRLTSRSDAAGGSETYTYDAQGTLVRRTSHDGSSTVYVGGMYEEDFSAAGAVTGVTKYYAIGGQTVAVRQAPDATGTQAGTLLYLLHDHLGGTVGLLDTSGAVVAGSQTTYWPYGAVRTGGLDPAAQTDKQYTGQRTEPGDQTLGLYNYHARFYSTVLGEFVSADTSTQDGLNRYAYVQDNPLRYTDPSGHCFQTLDGSTLPCDSHWATFWVACAMGGDGCSGDLAKFAHFGIAENQFWNNIGLLGSSNGSLKYELIGQIVQTAASGGVPSFEKSTWSGLGALFEVSGEFMNASTHDLIYGTTEISSVSDDGMVGAYEWWAVNDPPTGDNAWPLYHAYWAHEGWLSNAERDRHEDSMGLEFIQRTIDAATDFMAQGVLNSPGPASGWSYAQLGLLIDDNFDVDEAADKRQRELFQDSIKECFAQASGNCVSDLIEDGWHSMGIY